MDRGTISTIATAHRCHILLGPSYIIMAQAHLSVLLSLDANINKGSFRALPLARYASRYIGHAEFGNGSAHIWDGTNDLLDIDKPTFTVWLWLRKRTFKAPLRRQEAGSCHSGIPCVVQVVTSMLFSYGYTSIPRKSELTGAHVCGDECVMNNL